MSFITGLLLIDAPASALNNAGATEGARTENTVAVKVIKTRSGQYPYVSAQAFRYWLRNTLSGGTWNAAPIFRESKVAYTDANPLTYWDDDIFGYMRAPSKNADARKRRDADTSSSDETATSDTITRVSPFRVSTLVSIAAVSPTEDFGVMSRHEGDPVPYEHQFYRATLKGLFSLDLRACGTFSYRQKTGFRNLDGVRIEQAVKEGLLHLEQEKAYQLPRGQRIERIAALFEGLSRLEGGAKQALHYTDVAPPFLMLAVTAGGNHIFNRVVEADQRGLPHVNSDTLREVLTVFGDQVLSPIYVGWSSGYIPEERVRIEALLSEMGVEYTIGHPRDVLRRFIGDLEGAKGAHWLD